MIFNVNSGAGKIPILKEHKCSFKKWGNVRRNLILGNLLMCFCFCCFFG